MKAKHFFVRRNLFR